MFNAIAYWPMPSLRFRHRWIQEAVARYFLAFVSSVSRTLSGGATSRTYSRKCTVVPWWRVAQPTLACTQALRQKSCAKIVVWQSQPLGQQPALRRLGEIGNQRTIIN